MHGEPAMDRRARSSSHQHAVLAAAGDGPDADVSLPVPDAGCGEPGAFPVEAEPQPISGGQPVRGEERAARVDVVDTNEAVPAAAGDAVAGWAESNLQAAGIGA